MINGDWSFFITEIEVHSYPSGLLRVQSLPEGTFLSFSFSLPPLRFFHAYIYFNQHCRIAPTIDPEVLSNMRMSQFVGHAPKPVHLRRNQVPYDLERDWNDSVPESPMMRGKKSSKTMSGQRVQCV